MTTIIAPTDVTPELILIGFVATFLTVATVWILWYLLEKSEVIDIRSFLTFVVVIVPFVMIIYFGLDIIIDDAVATRGGWPTELPLGMPHEIPALAVIYIGLTAWLGLRWRKLNLSKRDTAMKRGGLRRISPSCPSY
jgi:hypothetical protein